jgi:hypothetical protein
LLTWVTLGAERLHELPLQAPMYSHPHFPYLLPGFSDVGVAGCDGNALQLQRCQTAGHNAREGLNERLPHFLHFISIGIKFRTEMSTEIFVVLSFITGTATDRLHRPENIPVRNVHFYCSVCMK